MKIWYQYPGPVSSFRKDVVFGAVCAVIDRVKRSDTEVEIMPTERGFTDWSHWRTDYARNLSDQEIIDTVSGAGEGGYDAAIIGMSHDPGLHEAKELLNIPVVGLTEAACHIATLWGDSFGIVTNATLSPHAARNGLRERKAQLSEYGMLDQCVGIRPIDMPQDKYLADLAGRNHVEILSRFEKLACQLVDDGAEVIIAGDTVLAMTMVEHNIFEVPGTGAPVVDLISSAVKISEMLVDIQRAFGTVRSRASSYMGPSPEVLTSVRQTFGIRHPRRS
jgi:Asp/Glu/hydantoin racemase